MKKITRNFRLRGFGLVIGLIIISFSGINLVQAAPEDPPENPEEKQTLAERQQLSRGEITPFETSPVVLLEDLPPEDDEAFLASAERNEQFREAER